MMNDNCFYHGKRATNMPALPNNPLWEISFKSPTSAANSILDPDSGLKFNTT